LTHLTVGRARRTFSAFDVSSYTAGALLARGSAHVDFESLAAARNRAPESPSVRLRKAIEHDQLSLHYQPQYELRDGRICGVEALARWFLPNGESILPAVFIPAAEKNGSITALGAWVLNEACSTVVTWLRGASELPLLCVNVSPRQISREFSATLADTLERTGFSATRLELEITESILIRRPALALDCLLQWKELGVRIALDDFGAGYSGLSYLSRLPVDRVKIDKSLIHRMTTDRKTAAIVRTMISLGADLGFTVLAEGVESEAQLTMLSAMGCQQAQGYLLALPTCAEKAKALLVSNRGERATQNSLLAAHSAIRRSHAF
jgi:diguanylate cyclase